MSGGKGWSARMYRGEFSFNIVGRTRVWYTVSAVLVLLSLVGLFGRGLNLGIEFKGGAEFVTPAATCTVESARDSVESSGGSAVIAQQLGEDRIRVQTAVLTPEQSLSVSQNLADTCGVNVDEIRVQVVGPSWGAEITQKALTGLVIFLIAVVIFLSLYFDWRMAAAALVALVHDVVITVGIYALIGFEVTPATVIGVLTILGYSLYDTVVIFDKVKENTRNILGQSRMTYSEAANLALNQTFIRSVNTSITSVIPVAAILFVGVGLLGAGTLKDLALALFVGLIAGTYSSLFIATPFLCQLKERQPQYRALRQRVLARRATGNRGESLTGSAPSDDGDAADTGDNADRSGEQVAAGAAATAGAAARKPRPHRTSGPRQQPKRTPRSKR